MHRNDQGMPRRDFLKTLITAGVGSALAGGRVTAQAAESPAAAADRVPTRPFGRTGRDVSILSLGGMFDIPNNQLMLRQCLKWGVTYWDTADCYEGGRSEPGFGRFFQANPDARKDVFLVTKSDDRDAEGMSRLLERSLERMNTDFIDLYLIHGLHDTDELTEEMKTWVGKRKSEGKIRLFGFSTHRNMEDQLQGAAAAGWIDGVMFSYNYRLMQQDGMKRAVDACEKAGVGMTAMKTQGGGSVRINSEQELAIAGQFVNRGFTPEQAKLKAVWENPQIACICSQMPNMKILMANIAAALNRTKLAAADMQFFEQYARDTCSGYCAGCGNICSAATGGLPVSDVMRSLMYYHSYGDPVLARDTFRLLSADARAQLARTGFDAAEKACPHGLPIARLVQEAVELLG